MAVTADVLKPLTSNDVKLEQSRSILLMSVTDDVSVVPEAKLVKLVHP